MYTGENFHHRALSLAGDEAQDGPLGKLDCLQPDKKYLTAMWPLLDLFEGSDNIEPFSTAPNNFKSLSPIEGSGGGGSVGGAVASNTRGPGFESRHRQNFINQSQLYNRDTEKTKIKKKRPRMAHL